MILPMAIPTTHMGTMPAVFTTPFVKDADLPGIFGLDSMADLRVIIDVDDRKMYIPGADTAIVKMEVAPSGHLMMDSQVMIQKQESSVCSHSSCRSSQTRDALSLHP